MGRSAPIIELTLIKKDGSVEQNHKDDTALFLEVVIEGEEYQGMVDTGASNCFMSKSVRDRIPAEAIWDTLLPEEKTVRCGNRTQAYIYETVRIRCSLDGIYVYYNFHVMETLAHPIIIGRDLLRDLQAVVKAAEGTVSLFNGNPVSVTQGVHIMPMKEQIVQVKSWKEIPAEKADTVRLEPSGISIAGVEYAINYTNQNWWMKVVNLTEHVIYLDKNDVIAYAQEVEVEPLSLSTVRDVLGLKSEIGRENTPIGPESSDEMELCQMEMANEEEKAQKRQKILDMDLGDTCMNEEEQGKFKEMLAKNADTIAFSMEELGHCTWTPMQIRVDESQGICVTRPYRYSPQKMDIIDEQIKQLLKLGIIEPSDSAWRSPLVVVQKKDGHARLCTDYRVLNMMTEDDTYPMPTARSLFLYMAYRKPTIFTAIDLLSGYHQCELHPDSRKYSSFESPSGVWQWTRVPFGMRQSPWQFTKIMSLALGGLMPRTCLAYLDDIIVFDPTVEAHIDNVDKVLQALKGAGLTIKPSKCEWGRSEIKFLGHVVNAEGLKTQPKVTQKVQEFGRPHDKHTVRSFLGLCNYYRNFIPGFATTAVPLNRLLKNKVPFSWTPDCETAFRKIQDYLVAPPLLIHPEIGGHFYIMTDASDGACGAAICHLKDGLLRPVVYYGYTFGSAERNYTITEREGLAVVKTLKTHESMLSGAKITIMTDHQPLIPLLQQAHKAPSKRLKRWALALTDFDYEIRYIPGKKHHLPDFLSRVVMRDTEERDSEDESEFEPDVGCELLELNVIHDELTAEEFRKEQWKDPECQPLLNYLVNEELPDQWEEAKNILVRVERLGVDKDGVLCKFDDTKKKKGKGMAGVKARIMVPTSLVQRVLYLLHDDILCGGHVGITALNTKIVERFYWRNLYMDIVNYVRACERCALRKRAPHFKSKAKSWDRPDYPWQVVQTDFIGPLRKSKDGYLYILTFIDLLTGWPEAFPTKNSTAATAATVFLQQIVCRYGKIQQLNSDRGPSYVAKLFKEITERLMCKQSFTSSRMPQGNARVERLHKSLEDLIGCYITENHENWPDLLPIALWNVRSTISTRTGFSPYALMFGRDNAAMGFPEERPIFDAGDDKEWFLRTTHCIEMFDLVAKENTVKYEKTLRERLNKTARPVQFEEGDYVFYYDPTCAENNTSKFSARYRGPYRIEEAVTDNRVKLKSCRTGKVIPHLVNINKLKRAYYTEEEQQEDSAEEPEGGEEEAGKIQDLLQRNSEEELALRLSEEDSEVDKNTSESEEDNRKHRKHAEPKGGSGMRSQKGDGASTREQTQEGGWEPPGVERDQADWDHLPTHSTPLAKEKTSKQYKGRPGEVTVRNAGHGRVTTTPGKLKSRSDVLRSGRQSLQAEAINPREETTGKVCQVKEVLEARSEDSEGSNIPDSEEEAENLKGKHTGKTGVEKQPISLENSGTACLKENKKSQSQNHTLDKWSERRLQVEPDSDEAEMKKLERKVQQKGRNEQQLWEMKKEKALLDKERQLRRQARDERALVRLKQRDKIAQKSAKAASEEEIESEENSPSRPDRVAKEIQKKKEATASSES